MLLIDFSTDFKIKIDNYGNERHHNVSYGEDKAHKLDLYIPNEIKTSAFVILIHGGGWVMGSKWHLRSVQEFLLKNGIPNASIEYRLVDGRVTYREQLEDVALATEFIMNSEYSQDQIVMLGESAGGHLAMLYGYKNPDIISKIITFAGPADLYSDRYVRTKLYKSYTQQVFAKVVGKAGQAFDEIREDLKEASPITHVSHVPTLTFQGTWDYLVNKHQSFALNEVLTQKGIPHELVLVKRGNHTLRFVPWWRDKLINPKILEFIYQDKDDFESN